MVTAHPLATEVGVAVLRDGGNAVDAAIAVHYALAVVLPWAGNIGGGGFLVVRSADGTVRTLDFRETAPMAATRTMYLDSAGAVVPGLSTLGHRAVGVPGAVAGLQAAHDSLGHLPLARLLQPAIDLATRPGAKDVYWYVYQFANHDPCHGKWRTDYYLDGVDRLLALGRESGRSIDPLLGCDVPKLRVVPEARIARTLDDARSLLREAIRSGDPRPTVIEIGADVEAPIE